MKKIFASLTALACAATIFTGCGKVDDDDKKDSGKKGSSKSTSDELEDVVNDMIDAIKDKDFKAVIKYSLPDDLADSVFDLAGDELNGLADEFADEYTEETADAELISLKKTEDIDEKYIQLLEKAFSVALTFTEYMEENDLTIEDMEDMDEEDLMNTPLGDIAKFAETLEDIDSPEDLIDSGILDKIESKITITEGCMAEMTMKAGGETETIEIPFYYVKGEGWNTDMIFYPSMIGYVKKSKAASANTTAKTLYNATNTALTEMDEEGCDLSGNFIIHSDDSLNYNVSKDFDVDKFNEYMSYYFSAVEDVDYFIVISDGLAEYVACSSNDNTGIFPIETGVKVDDGNISTAPLTSDADRSLDGLYEMAVKAIDKAS